jgi:hypothetical protein
VRSIDKRGAFLAAYAVCASLRMAGKAAHINLRRHYEWMKDAAYSARFQEAKTEAAQALEDEAIERATVGVFEPNVFQGRFCYPQEEYVVTPAVIGPRGAIREPEVRAWRDKPGARPLGTYRKSDALMMMMLRGAMPGKYRQSAALELSGPGGGPIEIVKRLQAAHARMAALRAAREKSPDDPPGTTQ